jgi:apolipoprotein N-acyltransferase
MSHNTMTRWGLVIASGIALALAFPKLDLNLVAWVAFIPLLYAIADQPLHRVFLYSWSQGLVCSIGSIYWVVITLHNFGGVGYPLATVFLVLLSAVMAIYSGLAFLAAEFVTRRTLIPRFLAVPIAWTAFEWLRSFFPIGFPWNPLGNAAWNNLELIQFAEVTGVYGVSALIIFFNAVVFSVIAGGQPRHTQVWSLSMLTGLMLAALAFGSYRIDQIEHSPTSGNLKVAMVQGNIPQSIKWDPAFLPTSFKTYFDQSQLAALEQPDLIIWPEAAAAFIFQPSDDYPAQLATHAMYRSRVLNLARETGKPFLLGAPALNLDHGEIGQYNRAYMVSDQGEVEGFYDKIHLVPFGEYVPMRAVLGLVVNRVIEGFGDLIPGSRQPLFSLKGAKLAVLICYESVFPDLSAMAANKGANLLVNITNDAWYGDSSAPYQLLAMAAMRSVETHLPMVRVANTGISAIISPTGRITAPTELFTRKTEIESVEWRNERTIYAIVGDAFAKICAGMTVLGLALAWFYPRKPAPLAVFTAGLISTNGHR